MTGAIARRICCAVAQLVHLLRSGAGGALTMSFSLAAGRVNVYTVAGAAGGMRSSWWQHLMAVLDALSIHITTADSHQWMH